MVVVGAYLACTSGGFDIAGGASDIGNSQEPQAMVQDTVQHSKKAVIYDVFEGVIVVDSTGNIQKR